MCEDFGRLVAANVLELDSVKEKANSKEIISRGLLCGCKQKLLRNYFAAISNLMVMIGSASQNLLVMNNISQLNNRINDVKEIFRDNCLHDMMNCEGHATFACPKMMVLFSIMQNQMEDVLFDEIHQRLVPFIGSPNGEKIKVCEETLDDIFNFAETALFHLSGLRINCNNIKDELYDDESFDIPFNGTQCKLDPSKKESCIFLSGKQKVECIHMFLHEGFYKVKSWFERYINLYYKYHKYPQQIHLVLDYKLMDKFEYTEAHYQKYREACEKFGFVCITNADHVDFGSWTDKLNIVPMEEIKDCVIA